MATHKILMVHLLYRHSCNLYRLRFAAFRDCLQHPDGSPSATSTASIWYESWRMAHLIALTDSAGDWTAAWNVDLSGHGEDHIMRGHCRESWPLSAWGFSTRTWTLSSVCFSFELLVRKHFSPDLFDIFLNSRVTSKRCGGSPMQCHAVCGKH